MGHRRRGKRRRWAVGIATSVALIACGGGDNRAHAPQPPPPPAPAHEPPPEPSAQVVETVVPEQRAEPLLASPTTAADVPTFEERLAEMTPEEREVELHVRALELEALSMSPSGFEPLDPEAPADDPEETALLDEITEASIPEDYSLPENRMKRLEATESDLPLVLNEQVVRMINYFTGRRGRKTLKATLGRAGAYRDMIDRILEEEGVPLELFHLAQAESGFRPKAHSYARATGMWQFMAFRGRQYQLRQDKYLEERYDPEKATRAAAKHLRDLYIEFQDWYLAMAAYNSGPGRVTRAIARGKTRDYWELSRRRLLPRQTRSYVPIILAMTYVGKNLDMYDLGVVDYAPPLRYDTVETAGEITLELIADATDSTVETLKQLNPALQRSATPPYSYKLRLPRGTSEEFQREIAAIPAEKRKSWRRHRVSEGETLAAVAKKYNVKQAELIALNDLAPDASALEAGFRLTVPANTKIRSYRRYTGAGGLMEDGTGRYRIARGDTLGGIGRRFGVSVAQLREWNGLPNTRIRAGRYLIVRPEGVAPVEYDSASGPTGTYTVRRGDSLSRIAQRHGISLSQLRSWNSLYTDRIQVGDKLRVPAPKKPAARRPASRPASSAAIASSRPAPAPGPGQYRIRSGDTLGAIADRFGVSVSELKRWNGLRSSRIRAGKYLVVRPESVSAPKAGAVPQPKRLADGERYRVRSGDTLGSIARRHRVSVAELRAWNGLRNNNIRAGSYLIIGPSSGRSSANKARVPKDKYRIQSGDTLAGVAERFGVSINDLREWNRLRTSRIRAGEYLVVQAGRDEPRTRQANAAAPKPHSPAQKRTAASNPGSYRIQPGDTLGAISEKFGVSVSDLRAWNGLRSSRIRAGRRLHTRPPSLEGGRYRIQRGDTLAVIAKRFKVTVSDLKRWNDLRSSRITAGDYLTVRPHDEVAAVGSGG